jgi:hypothetical protein
MENTISPDRFFIPSNSDVVENRGENTITITAPDNYRYVGYDQDGELFIGERKNGGTVSCDCRGGGECSPFIASGPKGQVAGCAGVCSDCRMVSTARAQQLRPGAGFIDFDGSTSFVESDEPMPAAFPAMFDVREVQESIKAFLEGVYKDRPVPEMEIIKGHVSAPEGHVIAVLQVFGRITCTIVPEDAITRQKAGGSASCSCTDGECTLDKKSGFGFAIVSCSGNCSGVCTLKVSSRIGGDVVYSSETYAY